jgi:hypothetical protein
MTYKIYTPVIFDDKKSDTITYFLTRLGVGGI